jgi:hypothetical protein
MIAAILIGPSDPPTKAKPGHLTNKRCAVERVSDPLPFAFALLDSARNRQTSGSKSRSTEISANARLKDPL